MKLNTLFTILTFTLQPSLSHANILQFSNLQKGWAVQSYEKDSLAPQSEQALVRMARGENGISQVLTEVIVQDAGSLEERLTSTDRTFKGDLSNTKLWRQILFADPSKSTILMENALTVNGQSRYVVEYETNEGTSTKLKSILLAAVVKGQIVILSYNQKGSEYARNITAVKSLFHDLQILNPITN